MEFKWRRITCIIIVVIIFSVFAMRLYDWQIVHGNEYREEAFTSITYNLNSEPTRGEIYDVSGKPFAVNETSYNILVNRLYLKDTPINDVIISLFEIIEYRDEKWIDVLPIKFEDDKYVFTENAEIHLSKMRDTSNNGMRLDVSVYAEPWEYMQKLIAYYDAEGISDKNLQRNVVSVMYNMWLQGFSNTTPYVFAENISPDTVQILSEKTQGTGAIEVQTTYNRVYKNSTIAPHIIGATGLISAEEYADLKNAEKPYSYNDIIGTFGVEAGLEDYLKGVSGSKTVSKNADGTIVNVLETIPAQPGNSIYLTLDSKLQKVTNEALERNVKAAAENGKAEVELAVEQNKKQQDGFGEDCKKGAAVMLRVSDFAVLAASTYPSYDLAKYSEYGEYYTKLMNDKTSPVFNNALQGKFAPGSIFKPLVACAALQEKVISEYSDIFCARKYDFYPTDPIYCMGYHEHQDLRSAIAHSCNVYFAETGKNLGIDSMYLYAEKFGLGVKTGLEISESSGTLAGRDSTTWAIGNTVSAAIGQSDNAFTPVQLATYCATIANNGVRNRTHIVDKIVSYDGEEIILENKADEPEIMEEIAVDKYNLQVVQEGMRMCVTAGDGTASYTFGAYPIDIAAKTGTAEITGGSDHTTFICYAPYDKPEVAIAVVIENGAYGKYSMDVAKSMLDAYFGIKN